MAAYTAGKLSSDVVSGPGVKTSAGGRVRFVSTRVTNIEDGSTTKFITLVSFGDATQGGPTVTPEKTNTRSATADSTYLTSTSVAFSADFHEALVILSGRRFNRVTWTASPHLYKFVAINAESLGVTIHSDANYTSADNISTAWSESEVSQSKRLSRRNRKGGFFPVMGNCIERHAKTGTGAYSAITPQFEADTFYVDDSAWRNGSNRQSTWNINLFGGSPRFRTLMGLGK